MLLKTAGILALAAAALLCGCNINNSTSQQAPRSPSAAAAQRLPAGVQIIHQKLSYLFNSGDSFLVVQDGDYASMGSLYENSGRFVQHHLVQKLMQHGSQAVALRGYFRPEMLQQEASARGCSLYMTARIEHLYDAPSRPKEFSVLINTYSTRTGELLDSVILNAEAETLDEMFNRSNSVAEQLINNYVLLMYTQVNSIQGGIAY